MARVMIGIPTLDMVQATFFSSILNMQYREQDEYQYNVRSNSLVYNARNMMAMDAINGKFDYLIFLDSDMALEPDTIIRLLDDIEKMPNASLVSGLYFTRRPQTSPVICKDIAWWVDATMGAMQNVEVYDDYPRDKMFPIAGCGFGVCVMKVDLIKDVVITTKSNPFDPLPRLSEDYAFCWRARKIGAELFCDSSIKAGHCGLKVYRESDWDAQLRQNKERGSEE